MPDFDARIVQKSSGRSHRKSSLKGSKNEK